MPIGTIIIWASAVLPTDGVWLECNGQSTTGYPALAAIVGSNVPDYRGVFLRGLGSITSTHYNTVIHTSGLLGVLQGDSIRNITAATNFDANNASDTGFGAFSVRTNWETGYAVASTGTMFKGISFDASRVVPTSNEIRPINKAVLFLIRAQ